MTRSINTAMTGSSNPDVVLIGAGIMSTTLAVILKELDPKLKIEIHEVLGSERKKAQMRGTTPAPAMQRFVN